MNDVRNITEVEVAGTWWVVESGETTGPHSVEWMRSRIESGMIQATTQVCPVGTDEWRPAIRWPEFATAQFVERPTPPASATQGTTLVRNPRTIAWLGLLFTPIWSGIMAAINGRRIGLAQQLWTPLVIGFGWLITDIIVETFIWNSFLAFLILLGAANWLLWHFVLEEQVASYEGESWRRSPQWLVPALAGVPLVLIPLLDVYDSLRPLDPREVCEQFLAEDRVEDTRPIVTTNMYPLLEQFKRIEALSKQLPDTDDDVDYELIELTDEAEASPEIGGYLVGCRLYFPGDDGDSHRMNGFFHLVDYSGDWKIDGWYFTDLDDETVDGGTASMTDFLALVANSMQDEIHRTTNSMAAAGDGGVAEKNPEDEWWFNFTPQKGVAILKAAFLVGCLLSGVFGFLRNKW